VWLLPWICNALSCGWRKFILFPGVVEMRVAIVLLFSILVFSDAALAARCLFVSSYHRGYAWSDGVERGVRKVLDGKCELRQLDMDTKRNKSEEYIRNKALEVKHLIDSWKPDVVIAADDNAAKYVIVPYYRDSNIPFVFCGINWSVDEYGFPYKNVTGMVEVAPVRQLFENIETIRTKIHRIVYIGADTLTEKKNFARFSKVADKYNYQIRKELVSSTAEWLAVFKNAQSSDVVVLGSNSGIPDWDAESVKRYVKTHIKTLVITNHEWMMPYAIFGMTKIPDEQGEWAALSALKILEGLKPSAIAIVPNRKWDMYINKSLLKVTTITMPETLLLKSKLIGNEE